MDASHPHFGQPVATAGAPLGQGRAVVIMIHGRGAGPANILSLAPEFGRSLGSARDRPEVTYLAPAATNGTWYPYSFLADREMNEPYLSSALRVVGELVDHVTAAGIPKHKILLLGFSQGACLSSEFAVRNAARYGGILIYSGGVIGPAGTTWNEPGSFDGTPVFLGCSDVDAHVPKARVDESAAIFTRMGATVTKRIYPGMGHLVNEEEIEFTKKLIDEVTK
jgi:phospholipase/carboxylesterase